MTTTITEFTMTQPRAAYFNLDQPTTLQSKKHNKIPKRRVILKTQGSSNKSSDATFNRDISTLFQSQYPGR